MTVKEATPKAKEMMSRSNFKLEDFLGVPLEEFDEIISDMNKHVSVYKIPKRKGGFREITNPSPRLKYAQKAILHRFLSAYVMSEAAHGFVKGRGIKTNAEVHVGSKSVGSVDIKDFFPSVKSSHINNAIFGNERVCKTCKNFKKMCSGECHPSLYKNKEKDYPHKCEEMLSIYVPGYCEETGYESLFKRIIAATTFNDCAPQGFPTSPCLANMALLGLDKALLKIFKTKGIEYTRYADDLSFSSKELDKITLRKETLGVATSFLKSFGFRVNKAKTKYCGQGTRQEVCGITVNEKLSIPRWKLKYFRARVHHATFKNIGNTTKALIRSLMGYASFVESIDEAQGKKYKEILTGFDMNHDYKDDDNVKVDPDEGQREKVGDDFVVITVPKEAYEIDEDIEVRDNAYDIMDSILDSDDEE